MNKIIRKYLLLHAHPTKFVAEILGVIFSVYFLWNHNLTAAVIASIAFFLLSSLLLWNKPINLNSLAESPLGRGMLIYSTPFRFFLYNFSVLPLIYGLWVHKSLYIIIAIVILFSPHLWGWEKLRG